MSIHELKSWPAQFQATFDGSKKFEVREDDRDFYEDDILFLREWDPETERYTGRKLAVEVTFLMKGEFGLPDNLCVMSIVRI